MSNKALNNIENKSLMPDSKYASKPNDIEIFYLRDISPIETVSNIDFENVRDYALQKIPKNLHYMIKEDEIPLTPISNPYMMKKDFIEPIEFFLTKDDFKLYQDTVSNPDLYRETYKKVREKLEKGQNSFSVELKAENFEKIEEELIDSVYPYIEKNTEKLGKNFSEIGIVDAIKYTFSGFSLLEKKEDKTYAVSKRFVPFFLANYRDVDKTLDIIDRKPIDKENLPIIKRYSESDHETVITEPVPYPPEEEILGELEKVKSKKRGIGALFAGLVISGIIATAAGMAYNQRYSPKSDVEKDGMDKQTEDYLRDNGVNVDPYKPDPVVAAGYKKGLGPQFLAKIDNLKDEPQSYEYVEGLVNLPKSVINNEKIPVMSLIEQATEDGTITTQETQTLYNLNELAHYVDYIENGLIPANIKEHYWSEEEINGIQHNLVNSVLKDGIISLQESKTIEYLRGFDRWQIQKDIINSGMIEDSKLQEDWDRDENGNPNLNNIGELKQGTNPLNSLETDPNNRSELYIVTAAGRGNDREDKLIDDSAFRFTATEYHFMLKNGVPKSNIKFLVNDSNIPENYDIKVNLLRNQKDWNEKNALTDFEPIDFYKRGSFSLEDFEKACNDLSIRMDDNDVFILNIEGHGTRISDSQGYMHFGDHPTENRPVGITNYEINKILNKMSYGKSLVFLHACGSEKVAENLDKIGQDEISPIHDTFSIGNTGAGSAVYNMWIWENLSHGQSLKESVSPIPKNLKSINYFNEEGPPYPPCPWIDKFNPLISLPDDK